MVRLKNLIGLLAVVAMAESACVSADSGDYTRVEQPIRPRSDGVVVEDRQIDATITYLATQPDRTFVAVLPRGWEFTVLVDGNADGRWGEGVVDRGRPPPNLPKPTDDRSFTVAGSVACPQFIYAALKTNVDQPALWSTCGTLVSNATYETSQPDRSGRVTATLRIPADDLFGDRPDARVVFSIWDGRHGYYYFFTPGRPLLLSR